MTNFEPDGSRRHWTIFLPTWNTAVWKSRPMADYARATLDHPLRGLLHQDPFTYRAFSKPRGYAGDAVMMDYNYGLGEARTAAREATLLGRAILQYMDTRPSAQAVRYRRRLLAALIDRIARRGGASVLAIAAGHLREVELSRAVQSGALLEFVALRSGREQPGADRKSVV